MVEVIEIEESGDQSNPNSTDPSLIVQLPGNVNDGSIPNASRTTAADFAATVTTILDRQHELMVLRKNWLGSTVLVQE